jgi:hypothetical protein
MLPTPRHDRPSVNGQQTMLFRYDRRQNCNITLYSVSMGEATNGKGSLMVAKGLALVSFFASVRTFFDELPLVDDTGLVLRLFIRVVAVGFFGYGVWSFWMVGQVTFGFANITSSFFPESNFFHTKVL